MRGRIALVFRERTDDSCGQKPSFTLVVYRKFPEFRRCLSIRPVTGSSKVNPTHTVSLQSRKQTEQVHIYRLALRSSRQLGTETIRSHEDFAGSNRKLPEFRQQANHLGVRFRGKRDFQLLFRVLMQPETRPVFTATLPCDRPFH